jgi:hypothetical protein
MGKQEMRKQLASLTFSEKVEILEKLRDRSVALAAAGLRNATAHGVENSEDALQFCNCSDWEPCGCAHQPPSHCTWCCRRLTVEQIAASTKRGFYSQEER